MTLREILKECAQIAGRGPPWLELPHDVVLPIRISPKRGRGSPRHAAHDGGRVRLSRKRMFFSSAPLSRNSATVARRPAARSATPPPGSRQRLCCSSRQVGCHPSREGKADGSIWRSPRILRGSRPSSRDRERALDVHGAPVYVLHEIVHNRRVVEDLERRAPSLFEELADVPHGAIVIFSAHGVARRVEAGCGKIVVSRHRRDLSARDEGASQRSGMRTRRVS